MCENYHRHAAATPPSDKHKLRRSPRKTPRTSSLTSTTTHTIEAPQIPDVAPDAKSPNKSSDSYQFPDSVYDLLYRCLDLNPQTRTTAEGALKHEFLTDRHKT